MSIQDFMIKKTPLLLLMALGKNDKGDRKKYASELARETSSTFCHIDNLLFEMKELGLVDFEKDGRTKYVMLTERGRKVADLIGQLYMV